MFDRAQNNSLYKNTDEVTSSDIVFGLALKYSHLIFVIRIK